MKYFWTGFYLWMLRHRCWTGNESPVSDLVSGRVLPPVSAASAVGRNPGAKSDVTSTMLLGQAVAETTGLYGLVVAIILMFVKPFG